MINNNLMVRGMIKSWEQMGIKIHNFTDDGMLFVSIPEMVKVMENIPPKPAKDVINKCQEMLDMFCGGKRQITIEYKIIKN